MLPVCELITICSVWPVTLPVWSLLIGLSAKLEPPKNGHSAFGGVGVLTNRPKVRLLDRKRLVFFVSCWKKSVGLTWIGVVVLAGMPAPGHQYEKKLPEPDWSTATDWADAWKN